MNIPTTLIMEGIQNKEIKGHCIIKSHCNQIQVSDFLKLKLKTICKIMLLPKVGSYT